MPMIPRYQGSVGSEQNRPISVGGSDVAQIQTRAIESFAGGVMDVAKTLHQYEAAKQQTENALLNEEGDLLSSKNSSDAEQFAHANAAPDGSNLREVYKKKYDELSASSLKTLTKERPGIENYYKIHSMKNSAQADQRLTAYTIKKTNDAFGARADIALAGGNDLVAKNPYTLPEQLAKTESFLSSLPGQTTQIQPAKQALVQTSVNSMVRAGQFNEARNVLLQYGDVVMPNEREKLLEHIDTKELSNRESSLASEDNVHRLAHDQKENSQKRIFKNRLKDITSLNVSDPSDIAKVQGITEDIERQAALGTISPLRKEFLLSAMHRTAAGENIVDNNTVASKLYTRLARSEDYALLEDDVLREAADGNITTQTATMLLDTIDSEKTNVVTGVTKRNDPSLQNAMQRIDRLAKPGGIETRLEGVDVERLYAANRTLTELVHGNDPRYKNNPDAASDYVALKFYGSKSMLPPKIDVHNMPLKDSLSEAKKRHDDGRITDAEYLHTLKFLRAKQLEEESVRARKDGVNK